MSMQSETKPANYRWIQLIGGTICMILIANLQYGWTLFVSPMEKAHNWDVAGIQFAFSIFIAVETWLTPVEGWIADTLGARRGPRLVVAVGGLLVGLGWIINAYADSLTMLYVGAVVSGIGGGAVYATCVGNAVKWFPDRRGLAVGITAAGYGAGAVVTVIPIQMMIASAGYSATFFWFGLVQGGLVFLIAWVLQAPLPGETPAVQNSKLVQNKQSVTPRAMLTTPVFWLLYLMFVLVSGSGLIATAQIALIAKTYNVANTVVLFGATTLTVALIFDGVANGAARPFFGWVSDTIGREYTMAIAFSLGAVAYWSLSQFGNYPWGFIISAALIFFTCGEICSLFPSTCTDIFGPKYSTTNASFLYTAKGVSAFLVPLAQIIRQASGDWHMVFIVAALMNVLVVLLAIFVLPIARRGAVPVQQAVGYPAE